jgi:PAS domain S-box-containing protein
MKKSRGTIKRWITSLRVRLLVLFWLVALIPLVTLAILDARATRTALTDASYRSLVAAAGQTASRIDQFFTTKLEIIAMEAALPILAEYLVAGSARRDPTSRARTTETLASFAVKDRIFISSSALLDLRGRNVIDSAPGNVGDDESEALYFRETLETNLPYAELVLAPPGGDKPSLYFSSPVRDARGEVVGVLRTRCSAAVLQQLVVQDSDQIGAMAFPLLVDDDQILLAHGAASDVRVADFLFKPTAPLSPERIEALRAARHLAPGALGAPGPVGTEALLTPLSEARILFDAQLAFQGSGRWAAVVRRLSQMPWTVVFVQPEHAFLGPLRENTRNTVRLALACAALVALVALVVARLLARPIEHLTQAAQRIARGEIEPGIGGGGGSGEIGLLADSLGHMVAQLQQREQALRERAEELSISQRESQNKTQILESILHSMSDGVIVADQAGAFLVWNDAATRILGRGVMGMSPRDWAEHYGLCLADRVTPVPPGQLPMARALRGESVDGAELFVRRTQGEVGAWISISSRPLRSEGTSMGGGVVVFNDITERKRAEEERTRMVEDLRNALRARDEFLAIASHELRTPLTPLKAQVQSLRRQLQRGDPSTLPAGRIDQALASLDRQVDRLDALVENLLDVSRLTRGQLDLRVEDVDLSALVSEVVERFRPEILAARAPIELCLAADLVGRWDRTRLEQVFTNLLTNALKYARGAPIKVVTELHADAARLIVQDRGIGIAPEHHQRIFQPFERAVSYLNISGFGLGLYIVHQIVDAHGGRICLESEPGHGTTFTIDLPLQPDATDSRDGGAATSSPSRGEARAQPRQRPRRVDAPGQQR